MYLNLKNFRTFLAHVLCIFVTYWPILPSLVIFAYVTDEGHRSERNVLLFFFKLLISFNAAISFYIMPDYNHGIFRLRVVPLFLENAWERTQDK